ncbi:unnamed protein product [Paramecium octaurelia]|uniref:Uncharacterized protein n=1 Tax=Paramecium octaurelia TaxID=43137 RepID=A0A8S1TMA5_PAROT|nr:unnamed protein product [Paramecium octaurelia]
MLQYEYKIQEFSQNIDEMKKEKNNQRNQLKKTKFQIKLMMNQERVFKIMKRDNNKKSRLKNSQLQKLVKDLEKQEQQQQDISQQTAKQIEDKKKETNHSKQRFRNTKQNYQIQINSKWL